MISVKVANEQKSGKKNNFVLHGLDFFHRIDSSMKCDPAFKVGAKVTRGDQEAGARKPDCQSHW